MANLLREKYDQLYNAIIRTLSSEKYYNYCRSNSDTNFDKLSNNNLIVIYASEEEIKLLSTALIMLINGDLEDIGELKLEKVIGKKLKAHTRLQINKTNVANRKIYGRDIILTMLHPDFDVVDKQNINYYMSQFASIMREG